MSYAQRAQQFSELHQTVYDVAVVGGGINGACLFHHLASAGYRVALLERNDFGGGTSQASSLLIWGGLLYLRHLDLETVWSLCRSRDDMLRDWPGWVRPFACRIVPTRKGRHPLVLRAALYFYWLLGGCRRRRPRACADFPERALLDPTPFAPALEYEEGCVEASDARFVLRWILSRSGPHQTALNYCALHSGVYESSAHVWRLELEDRLTGGHKELQARWIVNAAGVWADQLNRQCGLETPYRHVFSKGVHLGLKRDPRHEQPLILETRADGDYLSLFPWGPVSLWGPTETVVQNLAEGFAPQPGEVRFLLGELNRHLAAPVDLHDIVSLRCGVRPLVVHRAAATSGSSLELSRRHRLHRDRERPWISVYGGKLTGCLALAQEVLELLHKIHAPAARPAPAAARAEEPQEVETFPGLDAPVPAPGWCFEHEGCWRLEDYLRRRTNIAQWVPRHGLGARDEHAGTLAALARVFHPGNPAAAHREFEHYRERVRREFDAVLAQC